MSIDGAARAESSLLALCRVVTDFDNVKFSNNSIDLQVLREFCEREGEAAFYRKEDLILQLYEAIALK